MRKLCTVIFAGLWAWAGPALAQDQDLGSLVHDLERLKKDFVDLQSHVYGASNTPSTSSSGSVQFDGSQLHLGLQQLQEQQRQLIGRIESLEHQQRMFGQRLDDLIADLDIRMGVLERDGVLPSGGESGNAAAGGALVASTGDEEPGEAAPGTGSGILPPGTEMEQYNHAFSLLRKADHDNAEIAFTEFVALHPESDLTGNAYYWLGSIHRISERHHDAAVAFLTGYKDAPAGPKAVNNLLGLGVALGHLGKVDEACATFRELAEKFPDAGAALVEEASAEADRIGCN